MRHPNSKNIIPHGNDKFTLNIPCVTPGELLLKQKLSLAKVAYTDVVHGVKVAGEMHG